jgi:hypothetical protein
MQPTLRKLRYTVVVKYMNLPSKAGIAYQLSNNDTGILLSNGEKVLLKSHFDKLFYFDNNDILIQAWRFSTLERAMDSLSSNQYRRMYSHQKEKKCKLNHLINLIDCDCIEESCSCSNRDEYMGDKPSLMRAQSEKFKLVDDPEFKKTFKLLKFAQEHLPYIAVSSVWSNAETPNDKDKPVFIKKWSNCGDKLVFKLNAQIVEVNESFRNLDENWIKVLQVVNRDSTEIVLKYNTGRLYQINY